MADLDNELTIYLRETGESLSSLALRMGRAPSTLTRALNGERNPSVALARDVERVTAGRVQASRFVEICISNSAPAHPEEAA